MKKMRKTAAAVLVVLLAAAAYGLYLTARPFVGVRERIGANSRPVETLVDQSPLTTAQNLAQLPNSPGEQRLAQEALRVADHEVDLAFAAALREAGEHPPVLNAEAKKIQNRLTRAQKALDADNALVSQLTASLAKANGFAKDKLNDELNLTKSQQELDQDEVDDAKQDLIRAGGDVQARVQAMVQEHEAASHNVTTVSAPPATTFDRGLVSLYEEWSRLRQKEAQIKSAKQAAEMAVTAISAQHNALESKLDAEKSNSGAGASKNAAGAGAAKQDSSAKPAAGANQGDLTSEQSEKLINSTKRKASDRKTLSTYDKRIDDQKELADVYAKWLILIGAKERAAVHRMLIGVTIVLGILIVGLFFDGWFETLLGKTKLDRRQVETLRTVTRVTLRVLAVVFVLLVIFGMPSQLGTFLGLAGAGLTVALKDFIVGFIGWFVLMGKNGIRLGDWVEINGVTGEVVELGMFHTVLLETGNWTDSGHPTGRRVTFTNSFAIEGHYFNFSTSGQWLWDELQVVLPAGRDPYPIVNAIQKKVLEATAESSKLAEKEWQSVARTKGVANTLTAAPAINVKPVAGGVEIAVRYITRANERYQMRAKLYQSAVDLLGQGQPG